MKTAKIKKILEMKESEILGITLYEVHVLLDNGDSGQIITKSIHDIVPGREITYTITETPFVGNTIIIRRLPDTI